LSLTFSDGLCVRLDRPEPTSVSESVISDSTKDTVFLLEISLEERDDT
jgi:hypothetical protein